MVKLDHVVPTGKGGGFSLNFWDDKNQWLPQNAMTGSCDWSYLSFLHKTSHNVEAQKNHYFNADLRNCTGTVWVDDLSIEEIY